MSRSFGMVAAVIVVLVATLMVLQLWGVIHIGFLNFIKSGVTVFIILGAMVALFVIYGMFFWKGSDLSLREQRELKEKQQGGGNSSSGRISDR